MVDYLILQVVLNWYRHEHDWNQSGNNLYNNGQGVDGEYWGKLNLNKIMMKSG